MDRERYAPAVVVWTRHTQEMYVQPLVELGVPVFGFPPQTRPLSKLRQLRTLVRKLQPEVVHSYSFYTNFGAFCSVIGTSAVAIGSVRSDFAWAKKEAGPILGRLSGRWPRDQIVNSRTALKAARTSPGPFAPAALGLVRNAVDFEHFCFSPVAEGGCARIVGIGYLLPVKRWDRLLVALQEVTRRGLDCQLEIAGDGPLLTTLVRQSRELGIHDRVSFAGQTDVATLLKRATFVAHTADAEGCPNAVLEAMASGRAVVATDAGDIPLIVQHGKNGFVVRRDDPAALAEAIAMLVADRRRCAIMGQQAHEVARRTFGADRLVQQSLAFYRRAGWRDLTNHASRVPADAAALSAGLTRVGTR
jgi:glycosyltransferase involved in cell wall biosynthesis